MKKAVYVATLILAAAFVTVPSNSQTGKDAVKWYTIQEAEQLMKKNPRPLFIDTFTDWCVWCKRMDSETFTNPVIADILNSKFYPVKFNAEGTEQVTFMGQTFINDGKAGKAHQLAVALLQGQLSYPTVVFMTQENGKYAVSPVPGYRPPKEMEVMLSFFAENAYKTTKWEEYQKTFAGRVK